MAWPEDDFQLVPLRRKRRAEDAIPEDEKDSMLRELAQRGASGLSGFGWLLDTPGSMVRGLLSEGPMKALSALWETTDERVTGRELARQYGLAGGKDNWANFGGGLAAEILLDPLTYASFGLNALLGNAAKTAAGKAAGRAGLLADDIGLLAKQAGTGRNRLLRGTPKELIELLPEARRAGAYEEFARRAGGRADELLNAPMTATNRVSIPGIGEWGFDFYTKAGGDRIARAADWLGDTAKSAPLIGPVVRGAQAVFDPRVMGYTDEQGQMFAREVSQATKWAGEDVGLELSDAIVNTSRNIGEETFRSSQFAEAFRNVMEDQFDQLSPEMQAIFAPGGGADSLVTAAKRMQEASIDRAAEFGLKLNRTKLPNDIGYFLRQRVEPINPTYAKGSQPRTPRGYASDASVASVVGEKQGRRAYTRAFPAWVLNKMAQDEGLQDQLRQVARVTDPDSQAETVSSVLKGWLGDNAAKFAEPYEFLRQGADEFSEMGFAAAVKEEDLLSDLATMLRDLPEQFAKDQLPLYGNALNDLQRYAKSRARTEATADVVLNRLEDVLIQQSPERVVGGDVYPVRDALGFLGFDTAQATDKAGNLLPSRAEKAFARRLGIDVAELANRSLPRDVVNQMRDRILKSRVPREAQGLLKAADNFTQRFKTLALLFPSRYTRDLYSGSFASATKDAFSFGDAGRGFQVGRGEYDSILPVVRNLPEYQALNTEDNLRALRGIKRFSDPNVTDQQLLDELMIRKALIDAGAQGIGGSNVVDDLGRAADNLEMRTDIPGLAGGYTRGLGRKWNPRSRDFWNIFALRNRSGNPNWLADLGDRAAQASDSTNRLGAYLNRIRKGDSPKQAKAIADLTQVDYSPQAFTEFEREYLKRLIPFYSYTKGITPLVADNLINRPAGLMGQSIRLVNRAGEPTEDRFTPEYLRQSASIPLDASFPLLGASTPGITRFLTNIDLPHEGLLNLITPGVSNTTLGTIGDSVMKSGQNIMGQTNPILKGPLEYILNRQFYSGRQLSDLYSMLEHDFGSLGRPLEQAIINAPGGSRFLGVLRQIRDDRISPQERAAKLAFNTLTGMKVQDVDQDRVRRLAARTTLNELLDQATGMATYENLYIKPEDLLKLPEQEQKQYLLYRALQAEASRKARERKKAEQDPLAMFNL